MSASTPGDHPLHPQPEQRPARADARVAASVACRRSRLAVAALLAGAAGCAPRPSATASGTAAIGSPSGAVACALPERSESETTSDGAKPANVLGAPLASCGLAPRTGFYRDGRCETGPDDHGVHVACAVMTKEFLAFTAQRGNDLTTPSASFPGLSPGDRWCLCAARWAEAEAAGVAPPLVLDATHAAMLRVRSRDTLQRHAAP